MAGSEKMGYEHSRADLFNGASVIITPHARNSEADVARRGRVLGVAGGADASCPRKSTTVIVAYTSHLPHLVASALVRVFDDFRG